MAMVLEGAPDWKAAYRDYHDGGDEVTLTNAPDAPPPQDLPDNPPPVDEVINQPPQTPPKLQYEMGDQPSIVLADGTRRPMTQGERAEIARIEAVRQARRDLGMAEEQVAPAPGMPEFELRQLDEHGQPDLQQQAQLTPEELAAQHTPDNTPYTPEQLGRARNNLSNRLQGIPAGADVRGIGEQIEHAENPEQIRALSQRLAQFEQQRGRETEPTLEELAQRLADRNQAQRNQPQQAERGPRALDPHLIIGDNTAGRRGRNTDSYEIDEARYVGIKIKSIRTEILANEQYAQLYGECLKAINPDKFEEALIRYRNGNPTKEDNDFLTYGAYELSRGVHFAENANKLWGAGDTELLSRRNRDMRNLSVHEGEPRATEIVKSTMLHMAMRDPDAVEDMLNALGQMNRDRSTYRYKRSDEKITALGARLKLEKSEYTRLLNPNEKNRSVGLMAQRIHENANKARRAIDWVSQKVGTTLPGSSRHAAIRTMIKSERAVTGRFGLTSGLMQRVDENLEALASYLGPTVGDPEMRSLISQETLENQNKLLASEGGPRTFGQTAERTLDREKTMKTRIKQLIDDPQWAGRSQEEQNASLSGLRSQMQTEERRRGGGGFFAWLFSVLFNTDFDKAATQATGRSIHI
jgi:hypothetical protein